jgi:hypothetical protein
MTRDRRRQGRDERGAVAVLAALLAIVLFALAALVVDLGKARDVRRQSQNAADAAALAGANALYPEATCSNGAAPPCIDDAIDAVEAYADSNFGVAASEWDSCAVDTAHPKLSFSPTSPCISLDSATAPTLVRVYLPTRSVSTPLGAAIGGGASVAIRSFAEAKIGTDIECSLCFLGPVDAGNADFSVTNGSIAVNGDALGGPNSNWTATAVAVVGEAQAGTFTPAATKIDSFTDPLASSLTLPLDTSESPTGRTKPCKTAADGGGPGVYTGDIELPNSECTLQPGLYVISGTWSMKNNTKLEGDGVTLYVKSPGSLDFKNGEVDLTAGAVENFAIIYDRDNANSLELQGNGETSIYGTTYAPSSKLDFNGNSCFGFGGGPVIVDGVIKANGNKSCVKVVDASPLTIDRRPTFLNQ